MDQYDLDRLPDYVKFFEEQGMPSMARLKHTDSGWFLNQPHPVTEIEFLVDDQDALYMVEGYVSRWMQREQGAHYSHCQGIPDVWGVFLDLDKASEQGNDDDCRAGSHKTFLRACKAALLNEDTDVDALEKEFAE